MMSFGEWHWHPSTQEREGTGSPEYLCYVCPKSSYLILTYFLIQCINILSFILWCANIVHVVYAPAAFSAVLRKKKGKKEKSSEDECFCKCCLPLWHCLLSDFSCSLDLHPSAVSIAAAHSFELLTSCETFSLEILSPTCFVHMQYNSFGSWTLCTNWEPSFFLCYFQFDFSRRAVDAMHQMK